MVDLDNWRYETVVIDPDGYAIEMPKKSENYVYCNQNECQKQFHTDELSAIVQHLSYHGESPRMEKECDGCGTTMRGTKDQIHNKAYCSRECYHENGQVDRRATPKHTAIELTNDIRKAYGVESRDSDWMKVSLLESIHDELCDRDCPDRRLDYCNYIREALGCQPRGSRHFRKDELQALHYHLVPDSDLGVSQ